MNALQTSDLLRGALGITARDQDPALRIPAMNAAHVLANFRVRRGGDRAGIQNRKLAFIDTRGFLEPGLKQMLLQRGAISLAGAAAEIENMKRRHAQRGIVAQVLEERHSTRTPQSRSAFTLGPSTTIITVDRDTSVPVGKSGVWMEETKPGQRRPCAAESIPGNKPAGPESV